MNKRILADVALGLIVVTGFYYACEKKANGPSQPLVLAHDEDSHTRTSGGVVESLTRLHGTDKIEHTIQRDYHHGVETIVKTDGKVEVKVKKAGWSRQVGLSTDFKDVGLAWEPYYLRDFHALIGMHVLNMRTGQLSLNGYGALAYRMPFNSFSNVSVYTGYSTKQQIIFGLFLRFGNE